MTFEEAMEYLNALEVEIANSNKKLEGAMNAIGGNSEKIQSGIDKCKATFEGYKNKAELIVERIVTSSGKINSDEVTHELINNLTSWVNQNNGLASAINEEVEELIPEIDFDFAEIGDSLTDFSDVLLDESNEFKNLVVENLESEIDHVLENLSEAATIIETSCSACKDEIQESFTSSMVALNESVEEIVEIVGKSRECVTQNTDLTEDKLTKVVEEAISKFTDNVTAVSKNIVETVEDVNNTYANLQEMTANIQKVMELTSSGTRVSSSTLQVVTQIMSSVA